MTELEKAKAALESCDGQPVSRSAELAVVAIAHALVAIAERFVELETVTGETEGGGQGECGETCASCLFYDPCPCGCPTGKCGGVRDWVGACMYCDMWTERP